jgi:hypothetical protein
MYANNRYIQRYKILLQKHFQHGNLPCTLAGIINSFCLYILIQRKTLPVRFIFPGNIYSFRYDTGLLSSKCCESFSFSNSLICCSIEARGRVTNPFEAQKG